MSRHIMRSPDDLDEFEGGQASLTREMDRDKGSNGTTLCNHWEAGR